MSKRQLSDWLTGYIEYTKNTESPLSYHIWTGVSCLAAALQRRVKLNRGMFNIYPNNYIILVGPSGAARKGLAVNIGKDLISTLNITTIAEDNTPEQIIVKMKGSSQNYMDGDNGNLCFHCSVTAFAEELCVFTGYQNGQFLGYLTAWYNCDDLWTRETKNAGTDEIKGMCFNMLAATAPDWIPHILTREAMGGGFTARIIFIYEDKKKQTIPDPAKFPVNEELKAELLKDLESILTLTGGMHLSDEAQAIYDKWYIAEDKKEADGVPDLSDSFFNSYRSRRPTHLLKTAMCLSASRGDTMIIEGEDISRGLELLIGAEQSMPKVFRGVGEASYSLEIQNIMELIEERGSIKKSEVLQLYYRNVDDQMMDSIIKTLVGMKKIKTEILYGGDNNTIQDIIYTARR